jgi:hypothetical protein
MAGADLYFLTPEAAVVIVAALVPLALVAVVERRNARARAVLGLQAPELRTRLVLPVAVALLAVVLGLAAAQPVLQTKRSKEVRRDAEAFIAVDISRSMDASANAKSPTRLDRARAISNEVRSALPDVPMGIGTFTDRPLPLLLPTPDAEACRSVVQHSLAIESPPGLQNSTTISSFDAVAPFPLEGYFGAKVTRRLLVVITDAESTGFNEAGVRSSFAERPRTSVVLIRVGSRGERVFGASGRPESAYIPPPASGETLARFLSATRGRSFGEGSTAGAVEAAKAALGDGPRSRLGTVSDRKPLAPWLVLAGVLPLGVVLRRRNL